MSVCRSITLLQSFRPSPAQPKSNPYTSIITKQTDTASPPGAPLAQAVLHGVHRLNVPVHAHGDAVLLLLFCRGLWDGRVRLFVWGQMREGRAVVRESVGCGWVTRGPCYHRSWSMRWMNGMAGWFPPSSLSTHTHAQRERETDAAPQTQHTNPTHTNDPIQWKPQHPTHPPCSRGAARSCRCTWRSTCRSSSAPAPASPAPPSPSGTDKE